MNVDVDVDDGFVQRETLMWLSQRMRGARCVLRVNGTPGILEAVRAGMGVGILPCWLADEHASFQRVLPEHALRQELWLVVHHDLRRAARVRAVTQFLVRCCRRSRDGDPLEGGNRTRDAVNSAPTRAMPGSTARSRAWAAGRRTARGFPDGNRAASHEFEIRDASLVPDPARAGEESVTRCPRQGLL